MPAILRLSAVAALAAVAATACGGALLQSPAPPPAGPPGWAATAPSWSGGPGPATAAPASTAAISTSGGSRWSAPGGDAIPLPTPEPAPRPDQRPGLGTSWGEDTYSPITTVPFTRASQQPWAIVALRYNDEAGVAAQAAYYGGAVGPLEARTSDGSIGISLVGDDGTILPGVWAGGQALIAGVDGGRYKIVVRNGSGARFEIVASVDGLDVIDGEPASPARRGYLVDPGGELVIDGFRRSDDQVAAFRFGRVASSYAALSGGEANVGVIGLAIFAERGAVWTPGELRRRDAADPFPARSYATAPR